MNDYVSLKTLWSVWISRLWVIKRCYRAPPAGTNNEDLGVTCAIATDSEKIKLVTWHHFTWHHFGDCKSSSTCNTINKLLTRKVLRNTEIAAIQHNSCYSQQFSLDFIHVCANGIPHWGCWSDVHHRCQPQIQGSDCIYIGHQSRYSYLHRIPRISSLFSLDKYQVYFHTYRSHNFLHKKKNCSWKQADLHYY